jgi:hypothetical protein
MEIEFKLMDILREYSRVKTAPLVTRLHYKECSIAEHSYFVAVISLMVYAKLMTYPSFKEEIKEMFAGKGVSPLAYILVKSITKGLPEAVLSEVDHDTRRFIMKIAPDTFDNLERGFFQNILIKDMLDSMPPILSKIVELSENLSIYKYTKDEYKLGNVTLNDISEDALMRIRGMKNDFPNGFIPDLFTSEGWGL